MNLDYDSQPIPLTSGSTVEMITETDFMRLERKVDKLTDALNRLVLFEERQVTQGSRLSNVAEQLVLLDSRINAVDKKVDSWVNRGVGVWALAVTAAGALEFLSSRGYFK